MRLYGAVDTQRLPLLVGFAHSRCNGVNSFRLDSLRFRFSWSYSHPVASSSLFFFLGQVTVQATCCTLTAMSIDRYLLIVHAVKSRNTRTTTKAIIVNVAVWIGKVPSSRPVASFSLLDLPLP